MALLQLLQVALQGSRGGGRQAGAKGRHKGGGWQAAAQVPLG